MEQVLRAIGSGQVEWIRRAVHVEYDNRNQRPVEFSFNGQCNKVIKLLGMFKGDLSSCESCRLDMAGNNSDVVYQ